MLGFATVAITGALVFYTIGVFVERQSGTLKLSHIVLFYLGFTCDTTGTACMSFIAQNGSQNPVHATTGALAIILMIVHAVWATIVYSKKNPTTLARSLPSSQYWSLACVACALHLRHAHGNTGSCHRTKPRAWYSDWYSLRHWPHCISMQTMCSHVAMKG